MDFQAVIDSLPRYAEPLMVTIGVTLGSAALALVVAFALGLMTSSRHLLVRTPARAFVEFFRGSSVVVQLFWFAFAMPALLGIQFDYLILAGIVALGLNYGAYSSEVVRGAIAAVPKSQLEASTALNFTSFQRMRLVILPQAWPEMIPSLSSFAIMLLKASALVSIIGVTDITTLAGLIGGQPGQDRLVHYGFVLIIYFILAWLMWTGMRALERKAKQGIGVNVKPDRRRAAGTGRGHERRDDLMMREGWSNEIVREIFPAVWQGFLVVLQVTLVAGLIAVLLGLLVSILEQTTPAWFRRGLSGVFQFIRNTPLLVQVLLVWTATSLYINPDWSAFAVGSTVLGVHYASYTSESFRAGIEAIPKGQWEAATALSLPVHRTWGAVILPQMLRRSTAAVANWIIAMFKEVPTLFIIGVLEMISQVEKFQGQHYAGAVEGYTIAGFLFLVASYPVAVAMRRLEIRLAKSNY